MSRSLRPLTSDELTLLTATFSLLANKLLGIRRLLQETSGEYWVGEIGHLYHKVVSIRDSYEDYAHGEALQIAGEAERGDRRTARWGARTRTRRGRKAAGETAR